MIGHILKIKMEVGMKVIEIAAEANGMAEGVENESLAARISIITITMVPLDETGTGTGRSDEMMNQNKMKFKVKRKIRRRASKKKPR
jgi:hypothetical protein